MPPWALWLTALSLPPLAVTMLAMRSVALERLRVMAAVGGGLWFVAGTLVLAVPELASLRVGWPGGTAAWLGQSLLRVSDFSAPLVPLPAALWLVTVAVTPRSRLDRAGIQRTALSALAATYAFLTDSPALLVFLWTLSSLLFLLALSPVEHRLARRVAGYYLGASVVLLLLGSLITSSAPSDERSALGSWLIVAAVLIRKGIFPFHAWIPAAFDKGRLGPVLLFSAPQMGAYTAAVLVVPAASESLLRLVAILSLVTAVYGSALAVVQRDARRACGYLFVSQSALVLAGLDSREPAALAGSFVLWIASAVAFTGIARTVLALEARRGRLDLSRHHGGYEQMPLLASCFLVLGLASTGFPGTLGFIGQEMLVEGTVLDFPALGFLVVIASALTGLAILRMYFSLFCGQRGQGMRLPLLRREAVVLGTLAMALVLGGLLPQSPVASALKASQSILQQRGLAIESALGPSSFPVGDP